MFFPEYFHRKEKQGNTVRENITNKNFLHNNVFMKGKKQGDLWGHIIILSGDDFVRKSKLYNNFKIAISSTCASFNISIE